MVNFKTLTFFLIFTSLLTVGPAFSMEGDDGRHHDHNSRGHTSAKTMPIEYRMNVKKLKKLPYLNLDKIDAHCEVPTDRLASWDPSQLKRNRFMVVIGVNFLDFRTEGFNGQFTGFFEIDGAHDIKPSPLYFAGFWKSLWLSGSLVNPEKYPAVGDYGFVLEVPPQLILKTYQLDSTTPIHSDLIHKKEQGEDLDAFVKDYLKYEGAYNSEMYSYETDTGEHCIGSRRIFADGETIESHPFMTPQEMIKRGYPLEHNEIKFVPKGKVNGKKYKVKISGLWYKDIPFGHEMARTTTSSETVAKLKTVASDLGIDLVPLSQTK